jgi:hypothetical protein
MADQPRTAADDAQKIIGDAAAAFKPHGDAVDFFKDLHNANESPAYYRTVLSEMQKVSPEYLKSLGIGQLSIATDGTIQATRDGAAPPGEKSGLIYRPFNETQEQNITDVSNALNRLKDEPAAALRAVNDTLRQYEKDPETLRRLTDEIQRQSGIDLQLDTTRGQNGTETITGFSLPQAKAAGADFELDGRAHIAFDGTYTTDFPSN